MDRDGGSSCVCRAKQKEGRGCFHMREGGGQPSGGLVEEGEKRFGLVWTWPEAREDTRLDPLAKKRRCRTILEVG